MFPATENLLPIAQVLKSYGTEGEVVITFTPKMPDDIDLNEPVFLIFEGLPVPFFIEHIRPFGNNRAYLKLEDIDSLCEGEEIVGKKILQEQEREQSAIKTLSFKGYVLINQTGETVGIITGVSDFSGNVCLEIGDTLIPYHEDLLIKVNHKKKILQITLAQGLDL